MDDRLLDLALELKAAGLPWEPAVGCFTWDHQGKIASPSPFPKRIYFILSMKRFLSIFGDVEEMKRCLVWLPTWYQARQIIQRMQTHEVDRGSEGENSQPSSPEAELSGLYRIILKRLKASGKFAAVNRDASGNGDRTEWVRSVIASEVGDVSRLPKPLQDRIASIYDEVARAYVGWRRIQENQAQDWLPLETAFDENLLGDLGHFYSDYQRSIQSLDRIRKAVLQLSQIDERKDRDTYDRLIALILGNDDPQLTERAILDRLTNGDTV
jgi:hypothetical protein